AETQTTSSGSASVPPAAPRKPAHTLQPAPPQTAQDRICHPSLLQGTEPQWSLKASPPPAAPADKPPAPSDPPLLRSPPSSAETPHTAIRVSPAPSHLYKLHRPPPPRNSSRKPSRVPPLVPGQPP